jgi:hypothetical protein
MWGYMQHATSNVAKALVDAVVESRCPKNVLFLQLLSSQNLKLRSPQQGISLKQLNRPPWFARLFHLQKHDKATALLLGKGDSLQDAFLRLEEAKRGLHSILG